MKKALLLLTGFIISLNLWAINDSTIVTTLSTTTNSVINQPAFTVSIDFAEDVNDIDIGMIQVINGYAYDLRIGNTYRRQWTFNVQANYSDKRVGVVFPAGKIKNFPALDTWNAASDTLWVYVDYARPQFSISSSAPNPTNQKKINVQISTNEYVSGFDTSDIYVANAKIDTFYATQPNRKWSLDLSVIEDGYVKVKIPDNVAVDTAQNKNYGTDTLSRRFDTTPPSLQLSTSNDSLTNKTKVYFNIDFDEQVVGFDTSDFNLVNAVCDTLYATGNADSTNFIAVLIPQSDGIFSVTVKSNSISDQLLNPNPQSNTLYFSYDGTLPNVVLNSSSNTPTADDTLYYTVQFSEFVLDFTSKDIYYSAGNLVDLQNIEPGLKWSYKIVNKNTGSIVSYIKASTVKDSAGNYNTVSNQITIGTDHTRPSCYLYTYESNPTNKDSVLIYAQFNEPVNLFDLNDFLTTGCSLDHLAPSDSMNTYSFYAFPTGGGTQLTITLKDSSYVDDFDWPGNASNFIAIDYDITPPTVVVSSPKGNVVHDVFTVHFTFNEFVSSFISDSIHVTNGTFSTVYESKTGFEWTATITPETKGNVLIWLGSKAAEDIAGNKAEASNLLTVEYNDDIYSPVPTLSSTVPQYTNKTVIPVILSFDEEVINFEQSDLTLTNAAVSNFRQTKANQEWAFNLTPLNNGWIAVELKSQVCTDLSNNPSKASNQLSWKVDMSIPTVSITSLVTSPTLNKNIKLRISFSEPVDSFDIHDIVVENGVLSSFATVTTDKIWSVYLSPDANYVNSHGVLKAYIPEAKGYDKALNPNTPSDTFSIYYDGEDPVATIIKNFEGDTLNTDTTTLYLEFSEFVSGDILAKTNFENCLLLREYTLKDHYKYAFTIQAQSEGNVGIRVGYASVFDTVGNYNLPTEIVFYYKEKSQNSVVKSLSDLGLQIYSYQKNLYISKQDNSPSLDLQIINLSGQILSKIKLKARENRIYPLNFKSGVYLLKVTKNNKIYSQKIWID